MSRMRPPFLLLLAVLLAPVLGSSQEPTQNLNSVLSRVLGSHPGVDYKQSDIIGSKPLLLNTGKLKTKNRDQNKVSSSISNSKAKGHIFFAVSKGDFYVPERKTTGHWNTRSDTVVHTQKNPCFVASDATGNLVIKDISILFSDSTKGAFTMKEKSSVWNATGKATIVVSDKEGKQSVGFYTHAVHSVIDTEHSPHIKWTADVIEAIDIRNLSAVMINHYTGSVLSHGKTGSFHTTVHGKHLPGSESSGLAKNPLGSHFFQALTEFADTFQDLTLENNEQAHWTVLADGNYTKDGSKTVDWCSHSNTTIFEDNKTESWTTFSNGSSEVSQMHRHLLHGTKLKKLTMEESTFVHTKWLELANGPNYVSFIQRLPSE